MPNRTTGRRATPARKLKKEQIASPPQAMAKAGTQPTVGDPNVRSRLKNGIAELQGLHNLLLSSNVDADVLADLRDALNRVRNTAWVAQQYVIRRESDQEPTSVLSLLAGERIRAAYQLCQALSDDLKRTDIEFQRGSLVRLHEVTKTLTEQLNGIIKRLG
ncbi:MAG: hypothetical protein WA172_20100 [Terriglobales bacterium]